MIDFSEKTYFISGIDTGIGKTIACGALAKLAQDNGKKVLTQKPIQTGCSGIAEDIVVHRQIQGIGLTEADHDGTTCSYLLPYPASPHLSAKMAQKTIELTKIDEDSDTLRQVCDVLLIEGAGGLMVPMNDTALTADFIRTRAYPLILVTCGRLGSINHTLLSLALAQQYGIRLAGVVYNHYFDAGKLIASDTRSYLLRYVQTHFPVAWWLDLTADGSLKTA